MDLEQLKPIDLLPDREGKTVEEWLKAHPGVEIVARDRSSVYANAITKAAPTAVQVADSRVAGAMALAEELIRES